MINPEILRIACTLSEATDELRLAKATYTTVLEKHQGVTARLTTALYSAEIWDPIAIKLDDNEALICTWNGEDGYELTIVSLYN
jgi:hypothetical protein